MKEMRRRYDQNIETSVDSPRKRQKISLTLYVTILTDPLGTRSGSGLVDRFEVVHHIVVGEEVARARGPEEELEYVGGKVGQLRVRR
jgi:hypothetical protein